MASQRREKPLWLLLCMYIVVSFSYASLCGLLGKSYAPLAAFQVYALGCAAAFVVSAILWRPKRMFPPSKSEGLAGLASIIILTSSTLALLLPASVLSIVTMKGGALTLPLPKYFRMLPLFIRRKPKLLWTFVFKRKLWIAPLTIAAIVLSSIRKPFALVWLPFCLALVYVVGYWLKLRSMKFTRKETEVDKSNFLAAEQFVVAIGALAVASLASHAATPAPLGDWRLWAVAAASYGAGFLGSEMILHSTAIPVVFSAYRASSLMCALGAALTRGELKWTVEYWTDWTALAIAMFVVLNAAGIVWKLFLSAQEVGKRVQRDWNLYSTYWMQPKQREIAFVKSYSLINSSLGDRVKAQSCNRCQNCPRGDNCSVCALCICRKKMGAVGMVS